MFTINLNPCPSCVGVNRVLHTNFCPHFPSKFTWLSMPPAKPKPSEVASDAKKNWIPYLRDPQVNSEWALTSFLCYSDYIPPKPLEEAERNNIRFAFYDRDPVDVALDWAASEPYKIPVIMPANDKRPGGDWEAGMFKVQFLPQV